MKFADAAIPAGMVWRSPFAKWQGSLSEVSSLDLATAVTSRALADRGVDVSGISSVVLGWTVPQPDIFYGAPLLAARLGADWHRPRFASPHASHRPTPRNPPRR